MDQELDVSSINEDSAAVSGPSQTEMSALQHSETVEVCEHHLTAGQQSALTHNPDMEGKETTEVERDRKEEGEETAEEEKDPGIERDEEKKAEGQRTRETDEKEDSERENGEGTKEEEGDGREEGEVGKGEGTAEREEEGEENRRGEEEKGDGMIDEREQKIEQISLAVASLIPLPHSPSPDTTQSSPSSSRFVTPASTPSRSPSPPPPSSRRHPVTSPPLPQPQVTVSPTDFVDHGNDPSEPTLINAHQDGSRDDQMPKSHWQTLPTTCDTETQTKQPVITSTSSQTDAPAVKKLIEVCTNTECLVLVDSGVQTEEEEEERGVDVGCNTDLHITPELLERAKLAEQLAQLQSEHAAGKYIQVKQCTCWEPKCPIHFVFVCILRVYM